MKKSDAASLFAFILSTWLTLIYIEALWVKLAIFALNIIGVWYATTDD